jgi:hypothetical protein
MAIAVVVIVSVVALAATGIIGPSKNGSSTARPTLGSVTVFFEGNYTDISTADAKVTYLASGACNVIVPLSGPVALTVDAYDTHGNALNGVVVNVQAGDGVLGLNAAPTAQETTGSNGFPSGVVQYTTITFTMPANTDTGDIQILTSYSSTSSSGGTTETQQNSIIAMTFPGC